MIFFLHQVLETRISCINNPAKYGHNSIHEESKALKEFLIYSIKKGCIKTLALGAKSISKKLNVWSTKNFGAQPISIYKYFSDEEMAGKDEINILKMSDNKFRGLLLTSDCNLKNMCSDNRNKPK